MTSGSQEQVRKYFTSLEQALDGFDTFMQDEASTANQHGLIAGIVDEYLQRLKTSLASWQNKIAFEPKFRVSQSESGFPAFENVLELKNDRAGAEDALAKLTSADDLREKMVDFVLTKKAFPKALRAEMAERVYLENIGEGKHFGPLVLPKTIRVSVNPKTARPYY
ncbi:MAG: hypothetical protein AAF412_03485, partial [Pseudomonadota bacterium]